MFTSMAMDPVGQNKVEAIVREKNFFFLPHFFSGMCVVRARVQVCVCLHIHVCVYEGQKCLPSSDSTSPFETRSLTEPGVH